MLWIYKSAASVLIWLGEESENSDQAIRLIQQISNPEHADFESEQSLDHYLTERVKHTFLDSENSNAWDAFFFLRQPWFERLWAVQEFVAARPGSIFMYAGDSCMLPAQLRNTVDSLRKLYNDKDLLVFRSLLNMDDAIFLAGKTCALFSIRDRYRGQITYRTGIEHLWALLWDTSCRRALKPMTNFTHSMG